MPDRIKTRNGEVWVEGEILMITLSGEVTAQDIEKVAKVGLSLTKKHKGIKYNAVDISGVRSVPFSARSVASDYLRGPAEKIAFVCANPVARMIGSFFLRRYRITIPIRIVPTLEDARKWFRE